MASKRPEVNVAAVLRAQLKPAGSDTLQYIDVMEIHRNGKNFYPALSLPERETLQESIEANGLLEPLTVVQDKLLGGYRLISGHNRLWALQNLHAACETDKWQMAPCRVLPDLTEAQEQCAIIEANRQRKKDAQTLAEEARRLTEAYVKRKEAGEELPGRIRDRVAEALQVSSTKLAQLNAIKENLCVPGFKRDWEERRMNESVAYEISKLPQEQQYRLLDWSIDNHRTPTVQDVKKFAAGGPTYRSKIEMDTYLEQRAAEDVEFFEALKLCGHMLVRGGIFDGIKTRREGFEALKMNHRHHGWGGGDTDGEGGPKGLSLKKEGGKRVERSWIETWDMLACIALEEYGKAQSQEPKQTAATPARWRWLDEEDWPKEGQLVLLSQENVMGGVDYQLARCVGGPDDQYPFIDPNSDLSCEEFEDFDKWLPLTERRLE